MFILEVLFLEAKFDKVCRKNNHNLFDIFRSSNAVIQSMQCAIVCMTVVFKLPGNAILIPIHCIDARNRIPPNPITSVRLNMTRKKIFLSCEFDWLKNISFNHPNSFEMDISNPRCLTAGD